jgi:enoyl-CoA hydratase/carnithine racemase
MSVNVKTEVKNNILNLQISRPDKKNALTQDMYNALADAILKADADKSIAAIYITGSGDSFCAGNDLNDFLKHGTNIGKSPAYRFLKALAATDVPIVAAVNGTAVGIGVTMLLHCDFVYVAQNAKLSMPFVNLGLVPEAGSSLILPQLAGQRRAAEMLMLGEEFDADMAVNAGIANAAVPAADLQKRALETAGKLAGKAPGVLRQTKALMKAEFESVSARMDREGVILESCLQSDYTKKVLKNFFGNNGPK